ncbi:glycosyltransferase family 2 protein [Candidatus Gracilibacteria bacterium]|nr:glycosyltransferase family 2 protein [Candidatus Gracilibacteria bacterium]
MKLIIQIPCYNEEKTLLSVLKDLPTKIKGIKTIETQIIDDGSSDDTIKIAQNFGVNYILKHKQNAGLGNAFRTGVENALSNGADILVNTDGDNQYPGKHIEELVQPLINDSADIVMGNRQTSKISHFGVIKKFFQWFGSLVVRFLSGTTVPDSVSGFRAYSQESLMKLNVTSSFSYAVDTLIQAGNKGLKIESINIETNAPTRPSRLFKNIFHHMYSTGQIMLRVYSMYNPLKIFFSLGTFFFIFGSIGIARFLYYYIQFPDNTGKVQSLVLSGVLLILAFQFYGLGIIGDLISKNRKLIEDDLYLSKKRYYEK